MRRQFANEPDSIREKKRNVIEHYFSNRCVDGGEKFVLCFDIGFAKKIHQRGFACIRITYQRYAHDSASGLALRLSLLVDLLEIFLQQGDLVANDPSVSFNFPFTSTTTRPGTASLPFKVGPHLGQPGKQILIHRQLHLCAGLRRLSAKQKDVENKKASIVDAHFFLSRSRVELSLKVPQL